ncbi:hypothetical protein SELR_pSRC100640 (plasmid) [Selenomonas ruminantium subsp. lactilytica TAM6421]|jgi:uncharacterized protein YgiM (DUF1202 family)|uniref:SH3 domain-containing protein n=3 Tax=Selenomonas TaxID=970 RepID=A0A5D6W9X7_9FIRM|nr:MULTISPECIES: SH3 domain-containing protein [Selenomonas]TYZ25103.1 SH3 domain-containing protein [Selenomonas sp. mPRGC5]BAL84871.1 hypothetical protein SELR_pSRC100640 [Selenomonas ruminantium subsp. lactilytica TAM6421]SDP73533.1 Uncharacterized conserved protein YgiM, contains N-terminal SH3 domain, DUF1202 family [Selenomonas ruminantium]
MNKMKRIWFYVFLVCLLIVPNYTVASTGATNTDGGMYVVNCESWISLRAYASTDAPVIAKIPLGDMVNIIDDNDPCYQKMIFAHVRYHGNTGYALYSYLTPHCTLYRVANCNEWISLRSAPSADAAVITRIPLGEYVRFVKAGSNGYYYVYYKGNLGYALAEYLS